MAVSSQGTGNWSVVFRGEDTTGFDALTVFPTELDTQEIRAMVAQDKRDATFFSAQCSNARLLGEMQSYISKAARGEPGYHKLDFVKKMRALLGVPNGGKDVKKEITSMESFQRLSLIYDFWMRKLSARNQYLQSLTRLKDFPAQEFVRTQWRKEPREWGKRWIDAGGVMTGTQGEYGGRMLAAIGNPIWERISAFGTPFPPFDFNSGMGLKPISKSEAEKLKVPFDVKRTETVPVSRSMLIGEVQKLPTVDKKAESKGKGATSEKAAKKNIAKRNAALKQEQINAQTVQAVKKTLGDKVVRYGNDLIFCGNAGVQAGKTYDAAQRIGATRAIVAGIAKPRQMTVPTLTPFARERLIDTVDEFQIDVANQTREEFQLCATIAAFAQIVRQRGSDGLFSFGRKIGDGYIWTLARLISARTLLLSLAK